MKRFAFFPGCLIPTRHPAMEFAIRETLPKLGIEIVDLEGASCCPDPIYFKSSDKLDWLSIAARNLCLAEDLGLDIFTNCSGCTATRCEPWCSTRATWRGSRRRSGRRAGVRPSCRRGRSST